MKNKKTFACLLCVVMLASIVIAGCAKSGDQDVKGTTDSNFNETGLPVVKEKVTLKIAGPKDPTMDDFNEMEMIQKLEEMTNVHVEWTLSPNTGWQEKKNLLFASGDLPDAVTVLTDDDIVRYGSQGLIVPVESLIDRYMPNLKRILDEKPEFRKMMTSSDGHIYGFPRILEEEHAALGDTLWINSKWLEALNLQMPTTTEEFREVLRAFRDQDPNGNNKKDEIPFSFVYGGGNTSLYSLFGLFGRPDYPDHIDIENGKIIYTAIQPEYKEAVNYFHSLYAEGLIDVESFTQKVPDLNAKASGPEDVVGAFVNYNNHGIVGAAKMDYYKYIFPALKGPNGDQKWGSRFPASFTKGGLAITKANKYPEITARWLDQVYDPDTSIQFAFGPFGVTQDLHEDGKFERKPIPEGMTFAEFRGKEAPHNFFVYVMLNAERERMILDETEQRRQQLYEDAKSYLDPEIFPPILFAEQDAARLAALKTDINGFVDKKTAEWIINGNIEAEWDAYISQLKSMGLDELIQLYESNFERYQSN